MGPGGQIQRLSLRGKALRVRHTLSPSSFVRFIQSTTWYSEAICYETVCPPWWVTTLGTQQVTHIP